MTKRIFIIILCLVFIGGQYSLFADAVQEKYDEAIANKEIPHKISLDIKGMEMVDVLKLLANEGGLNIVVGKNVSGRVSVFLKDVDIQDAFEIIIATNGLAYEKRAGIIKVMNAQDYELIYGDKFGDRKVLSTRKIMYADARDLSNSLNNIKSSLGRVAIDGNSNSLILLDVPEKIEAMAEIIDKMDKPSGLETRVFELNYAQPKIIREQLSGVLTKDLGSVRIDERTNKIVVVDYPDKIAQMEKIVKAFDERTKQVLIEAKIMQVTLSDEYQMGIDWKVIASKQLNLTTFNINRTLDTAGSQVVAGTIVPASTEDFRVVVNMLKTFGDARTLSTPRITATNGQEAKILVGSKEVYVTSTVVASEATTTTSEAVQFVDVGVKLYVTPIINKDNFITMKIRPEVSSVSKEFTKNDGTKIPVVGTSEAETSVIVKDGVTIVMGGLMKDEKTKNIYKIPLLGEIPFLGAFFRRTEDENTKTELVIFLTPRIVSGAEDMFKIKGEGGLN
ncbi:MAG: secretin N-terminal domain-containing protein [Candidatus Omnitrophica bacterium]|nr:secretin N-terminal domain-containing protein [Candidatus Omnitrophota bacterium]